MDTVGQACDVWRSRYDRALEKANVATLEAAQLAAEGAVIGGEEEEDDMRSALDESVVRARRAAAAGGSKGGAAIAEEVKARRQQDEEDLLKQGALQHGGAAPHPVSDCHSSALLQ